MSQMCTVASWCLALPGTMSQPSENTAHWYVFSLQLMLLGPKQVTDVSKGPAERLLTPSAGAGQIKITRPQ